MHSLGKSSKWPSYDSLSSSTPSLLLSESEHTEDEADVFSSEGEGESRGGKLFSAGEVTRVAGIHFAFPGHSEQSCCKSDNAQAQCCPDKVTHPASAPSLGASTLGSLSATPGDLAFAQKCADLQRFIRPVFELLNGLKTGRFDKGLNSFQQSVAMDRLQRILGVLQKPDMGEKYLRTLLQVEMMLKVWFPQTAKQSLVTTTQSATPILPSRWRQNQLHIPVKKRKMSWTDPDPSSTISPPCKRHQQVKLESSQAVMSHDTVTARLSEGKDGPDRGSWTMGQDLTDSTGTLNRPTYLCSRKENRNWKLLAISPPSPCGSPATQDGSVSSSSSVPVADSP
ncbi:circadian associated repressor of transcription a [Polymixia lowei]